MSSRRFATGQLDGPGGMLKVCSEPGCDILTLGGPCVFHDLPVPVELPRGVPHLEPVPASMQEIWTPVADPRLIRA
jgi:hypothetical protein